MNSYTYSIFNYNLIIKTLCVNLINHVYKAFIAKAFPFPKGVQFTIVPSKLQNDRFLASLLVTVLSITRDIYICAPHDHNFLQVFYCPIRCVILTARMSN
jgi:hypothetical protein